MSIYGKFVKEMFRCSLSRKFVQEVTSSKKFVEKDRGGRSSRKIVEEDRRRISSRKIIEEDRRGSRFIEEVITNGSAHPTI